MVLHLFSSESSCPFSKNGIKCIQWIKLLEKGGILMCTAATYQTKDFYFGRTLDYEYSYGEEIVVTPRRYPFSFRHVRTLSSHYAIIGTAHVADGYPLYYDGINEKGLAMAGLNFVGNAFYREPISGKDNIAQFEFIPWILGQCATVEEAQFFLSRVNLTPTLFSSSLPVAQLHWIIADRNEAIVVESTRAGFNVYQNPTGVLTNNPTFPEQLFSLNNYMALSPKTPANHFSCKLDLQSYSRGMGALGLPGDLSSQSRFVRAAFTRLNSQSSSSECESISQLFHILGSVAQQRGCCELEDGQYEITLFTSCCNVTQGIYYYTTYDNSQISAVSLHRCDLDQAVLVCFPMLREQRIYWQN